MGSLQDIVIAVDLDDVLSQTNQAVADWHNDEYGTSMTLEDFHYYHYWKNPYWGPPLETYEKVQRYYKTHVMSPKPVDGALEGVKELKDMGCRLLIVTASHESERDATQKWIDQYYPGIFEATHCTGQFLKDEDGAQLNFKVGKADICHRIGAKLLIDDSAENAVACAKNATPPINVLCYGSYSWNQRISSTDKPEDHLSYEDRLEHEGGIEWWKHEKADVHFPSNIKRARDWLEVVSFVRNMHNIWP